DEAARYAGDRAGLERPAVALGGRHASVLVEDLARRVARVVLAGTGVAQRHGREPADLIAGLLAALRLAPRGLRAGGLARDRSLARAPLPARACLGAD